MVIWEMLTGFQLVRGFERTVLTLFQSLRPFPKLIQTYHVPGTLNLRLLTKGTQGVTIRAG